MDNSKTDSAIGKSISNHLKSLGLETPTIENGLTDSEKIEKVTGLFTEIMETLGLDLSDDSLVDTPKRVAKMYVNEFFWGLKPENFPKCTAISNKMDYDEMVIVRDIKIMSNCEHHFVTIDGIANIAYIPEKKVIGLSKLNRIADYFSRRPQVQERLTSQIFHSLCHILETDNVAVMIDATHYCVKARGIQDAVSHTVTSKLGGVFKKNASTRAEFLELSRKNRPS